MSAEWTIKTCFGKGAAKLSLFLLCLSVLSISACTTNPATGESQFTALLPTEREASLGAEEHRKVEKSFGNFMDGPIANYVQEVGQKIAVHTERKDVQYKFYVIDSPIVNAFAIPGGYIYISRGLLALANNEAEMASVLAHEIGHITGRHAAERVSQGFLATLGATILSAAVDAPGVGRAAGVGSELYIKSYSRGQEHQADELGVRYAHRAGYDPFAMSSFLASLGRWSDFEAKLAGRNARSGFNYFSTHPLTEDRVVEASAKASAYPKGSGIKNKDRYFRAIQGLDFGDSADQGFVRGQKFYHPNIGFMFEVPAGFKLTNNPSEVVASHKNGSVILFDGAADKNQRDPLSYLTQVWMRGESLTNSEAITIHGKRAATAAFKGKVKGKTVTIRLVAIEWKPGQFFRFQMAIPRGASGDFVEGLKRTTYSFRSLSASEKRTIRPYRIKIITAQTGDTVSSLARLLPFPTLKEERFRALNGMTSRDNLIAGRQYKTIIE